MFCCRSSSAVEQRVHLWTRLGEETRDRIRRGDKRKHSSDVLKSTPELAQDYGGAGISMPPCIFHLLAPSWKRGGPRNRCTVTASSHCEAH